MSRLRRRPVSDESRGTGSPYARGYAAAQPDPGGVAMAHNGGDSLPDPPAPPEMPPRTSLHRSQWILVPLVLSLPLLALLGLFSGRETTRADLGPLAVQIRYPTKLRYNAFDNITLHVHNRGTTPLDTVSVALDSSYVAGFSMITSVPPFDASFTVSLPQLEAGESRLVRIELRAERYWRQRGVLAIGSRGTDTLRIPLATFVFP